MPAFPTGMKFDWRDFSEAFDPVVERAEMERGLPKQRRINSDARGEFSMTLYFDTPAEITAFEAWFFTDIRAGQDFFTMQHPRTGATINARVKGGELGPLQFLEKTFQRAKRTLKIEYLRPAY